MPEYMIYIYFATTLKVTISMIQRSLLLIRMLTLMSCLIRILVIIFQYLLNGLHHHLMEMLLAVQEQLEKNLLFTLQVSKIIDSHNDDTSKC